MKTRPLTWDIERGHEMWDADVPISEIARTFEVSIPSVMFQAHKNGWSMRARGHSRKYPCIDCRTPNSAVRTNSRCPSCSMDARHARNRDRYGLLPQPEIVPTVEVERSDDLDIECYRAHKRMREDEIRAQMREIRASLEHEIELTKPKAGRPKKRGFMPQTFGKYAA